jgi:hypothetical protein
MIQVIAQRNLIPKEIVILNDSNQYKGVTIEQYPGSHIVFLTLPEMDSVIIELADITKIKLNLAYHNDLEFRKSNKILIPKSSASIDRDKTSNILSKLRFISPSIGISSNFGMGINRNSIGISNQFEFTIFKFKTVRIGMSFMNFSELIEDQYWGLQDVTGVGFLISKEFRITNKIDLNANLDFGQVADYSSDSDLYLSYYGSYLESKIHSIGGVYGNISIEPSYKLNKYTSLQFRLGSMTYITESRLEDEVGNRVRESETDDFQYLTLGLGIQFHFR